MALGAAFSRYVLLLAAAATSTCTTAKDRRSASKQHFLTVQQQQGGVVVLKQHTLVSCEVEVYQYTHVKMGSISQYCIVFLTMSVTTLVIHADKWDEHVRPKLVFDYLQQQEDNLEQSKIHFK